MVVETAAPGNLSELAGYLDTLVERVSAMAARLDDRRWREPYAPGKWTRIEVMGHLLDSAAHNHQRFARAMHEEAIEMPGYDGAAQVRAQCYADAPVALILDAWCGANRVLSYVLAQIPESKEPTPCSIGTLPAMTLRALAFDYVAHLERHLRQVFES